MDYPTLAAAVASLKTATDIVKLIREGGVTLREAEAKMKLAELVSALADARMGMADVQQQLLERDAKIRELGDRLILAGQMTFEQPVYYRLEGTSRDGPFANPATTRMRNRCGCKGSAMVIGSARSARWQVWRSVSKRVKPLRPDLFVVTTIH